MFSEQDLLLRTQQGAFPSPDPACFASGNFRAGRLGILGMIRAFAFRVECPSDHPLVALIRHAPRLPSTCMLARLFNFALRHLPEGWWSGFVAGPTVAQSDVSKCIVDKTFGMEIAKSSR